MSFTIHINTRFCQPIACEAIIEAVAMYVGGAVPNNTRTKQSASEIIQKLDANFANYTIARSSLSDFEVYIHYPTNGQQQAFAQIYTLVIGFRRANLLVECSGEFAPFLPRETKPANNSNLQVQFQKVGIDHDSKASKKFRFSPEQLTHWYHYFGSITTLAQANQAVDYPGKHMLSDHCYLWKLPEGLMIRSKVENDQLIDHQILGFTFPFNAMQKGMPLSRPSRRRTWGEAWLPHEVAGQILTGYVRLEDEIAIVTDRFQRYQIEEPSSLNRRAMTFGKGASTSFSFDQWVQFAQHYHDKKDFKLAVLCLKQAELLAETAEQRISVSTLLSSMRPPRRLRILHSNQLRRLALTQLETIVEPVVMDAVISFEKQRNEAYAFSDYGRMPWEVPQADNDPIAPKAAKDAGMTQEILEHLLNRNVGGYFPELLSGLFSFQVNGRRIWGGRDTGVYFVEGIADTVFRS